MTQNNIIELKKWRTEPTKKKTWRYRELLQVKKLKTNYHEYSFR